MSEGNERNRENAVPAAENDIELKNAPAEEVETPAEQVEIPAEEVEVPAAETEIPEEDGEAPEAREDDWDSRENARPKGKRRGKRRRKRRSAVLPLVLVLVVLLVMFGVLLGYGLGRVHGNPNPEGTDEESAAGEGGAPGEVPAYDPFSEELTMENQQALDLLSGEDGPVDEGASALLGDDSFFDEETPEAEAPAESVVVAEFGDGEQLMSDEVLEVYNEQLTDYIFSGYSEEDVAETLLDDVLQSMVRERVLKRRAEEMGLTELTDADREQISAQAQEDYDAAVTYYRDNVVDTTGMSEEEAIEAAKNYLQEFEGVTPESIEAELEESWWENKLYDALTGDVTVDDAAVQAAYDDRLAKQRETFTESPDEFEFSQKNGETILYNPPGYRAVKVLLIGFSDPEAEMAVFALTDEFSLLDEDAPDVDEQERQRELDAYYAAPEAEAAQCLEQLRAGADMDEMILSAGSDPGMRDDRQRAMGYYVCADTTLWPEEFVAAAMSLENVGDYSEPVRTEEGVCILQYLGEVPEGEVPLANVRDALEEDVLQEARDEAYMNQTQAWVDEANPVYYPDRMQ